MEVNCHHFGLKVLKTCGGFPPMISPFLPKVTAFVTRTGVQGLELLLFQHPFAGIQIPAGTVEEGETLNQAVLREVHEETGLEQVHIHREIGWRDELPSGATHIIQRHTLVYARPDPNSFAWAEFHRGHPVRLLRQQNGYAQVTYEEGDRYPNPIYLTYVITGWVPESTLAATNRRYFFHLICDQTTPEQWETLSDSLNFQPFWAVLARLPEITAFQQGWLDFVQSTLGYRFDFGE